jgi:hypothetical protein
MRQIAEHELFKMAGFYLWDKKDICVIRYVHGRPQVSKLVYQNRYKEFVGCFSIFNNAR